MQNGDDDNVNLSTLHCEDSSDNKKYFCLPPFFSKVRKVLVTFARFVGPGFMVRTLL
jgi:hypothetical protein